MNAKTDRLAVDRELIRKLYIRVCRDSGFNLDLHRACSLVAKILKLHPLDVWMTFPSLDVMFAIAAGDHPSLSNPRYATVTEPSFPTPHLTPTLNLNAIREHAHD